MFLTNTTHVLSDALLTIAYPQKCAICSHSVESHLCGIVCDACWKATRIFTGDESMCWKCGSLAREGVRPVDLQQIRCRSCESQLFQTARACGVYEGALRESVLLLKRQPNIPRRLIDLLVVAAKRPPLNLATRLIPVPLHSERERRRGFNQASVIARAIASSLDLVIDEESLIRVVASHKYRAGLDAKGRHDTVDGAFTVRFQRLIAGESILLVDDVFTTGATASSCALALLSAGAERVQVLTIARPAR